METGYKSNFVTALLDLVYPRYCLICLASLNRTDRKALCADCENKIEFISQKTACPKCGIELGPYVENEIRCRDCAVGPPRFTQAFAVARYTGVMRELIHKFKFGREKILTGKLASLMLDKWNGVKQDLPPIDLIVPTPLHKKRLKERGFNQCKSLALGIGAATGIPVETSNLVKIKPTPDQTALNSSGRRENVIDAFAVRDRNTFKDTNVLLIDDVLTTGATASEMARALKTAGAKKVFVLVLGR